MRPAPAEAKNKAAKCVPTRKVSSKIEVRFKVQANAGADLRKDLKKLESLFMRAMGGIEFGIAAVQLFADSNGHVNPQGRGFIWVCDLDST